MLVNIAKYGVGSVIGLYLTYQVGSRIPFIEAQIATVKAQSETIMEQHKSMIEKFDESARESRKQTLILQRICLNGSETATERQNCIPLE